MQGISHELYDKLARLAASEGVELVAAEVTGSTRRPVVRLVLDRPEGGVSLADCERVSRQASVLLDAYDPLPGPFTLEVTSPGLDRKLYDQRDFDRFAGRAVRVRMRPSWQGNRLVTGILIGRQHGAICLQVGSNETVELPEGEVFETRLDPFPKENRRHQRGRNEP
jgi:ribosome maturation factor RimP